VPHHLQVHVVTEAALDHELELVDGETETSALVEWHRAQGRTVSLRTEQAMVEAGVCAEARCLIGDARHIPYAADPDLKRLRAEAVDALRDLDEALYAKAIDLFDADNEGGEG